jgi:hypothetical protein
LPSYGFRANSGSLAIFAATRRALKLSKISGAATAISRRISVSLPAHPTPKVSIVGVAGLSKKTPNLLSLLPESREEIADPVSGSVMLKIAGHKIYRFCDSIIGGILFWGSVLLIAVVCVAGVAGYAASYLIPLEAMALVILIFIVIEYWRSRL